MSEYILISGEGMQKPAYLAILAVSVVVAAGSLGTMLTRYLGLRAYSPVAAARDAAPPSAEQVVPAPTPEQWNNPFAPAQGMKLPSRLASANAGSTSEAPRTNFVLVGTIVSSSPAARRAILWADGMKQPKAFREKEEVEPGAFLSSVERDKVWIARGKEREKLDLLPVGSRVRPTTASAPAAPQAAASPAPGVVPPAAGASPPDRPASVSRPVPASPPARPPTLASPPADPADEESLTYAERRELRRQPRGMRR